MANKHKEVICTYCGNIVGSTNITRFQYKNKHYNCCAECKSKVKDGEELNKIPQEDLARMKKELQASQKQEDSAKATATATKTTKSKNKNSTPDKAESIYAQLMEFIQQTFAGGDNGYMKRYAYTVKNLVGQNINYAEILWVLKYYLSLDPKPVIKVGQDIYWIVINYYNDAIKYKEIYNKLKALPDEEVKNTIMAPTEIICISEEGVKQYDAMVKRREDNRIYGTEISFDSIIPEEEREYIWDLTK